MAFCENCGAELNAGVKFCESCGAPASVPTSVAPVGPGSVSGPASAPAGKGPGVSRKEYERIMHERTRHAGVAPGFSPRIDTDEFRQAMDKSNRTFTLVTVATALLLSPLLILIAAILTRTEAGILFACYIIVEVITLVICIWMLVKRFGGKSWDGTVEKKYMKRERSGKRTQMVYVIECRTDDGRIKKVKERTRCSMYDYLSEGDRVRYHPRLNYPLEKFDKTLETNLLCPFCGNKQPIEDDTCEDCKKPLLK